MEIYSSGNNIKRGKSTQRNVGTSIQSYKCLIDWSYWPLKPRNAFLRSWYFVDEGKEPSSQNSKSKRSPVTKRLKETMLATENMTVQDKARDVGDVRPWMDRTS